MLIIPRNVTNAVTGAFLSTFTHDSGPMTGYVFPLSYYLPAWILRLRFAGLGNIDDR